MSISNITGAENFNSYVINSARSVVGESDFSITSNAADSPNSGEYLHEVHADVEAGGGNHIFSQTYFNNNGSTKAFAFGSSSDVSDPNSQGSVCFMGADSSTFSDVFAVGGTAVASHNGALCFTERALQSSGVAGGATALPATPATYLRVQINNIEYVLPLYFQT